MRWAEDRNKPAGNWLLMVKPSHQIKDVFDLKIFPGDKEKTVCTGYTQGKSVTGDLLALGRSSE
jgi:hypothetical protein